MIRTFVASSLLLLGCMTLRAQILSTTVYDTIPHHEASFDSISVDMDLPHIPQKVGMGVGFRISIYDGGSNNSARMASRRAASQAKLYFPELSAESKFKGHWRCLIGDFRTYAEAAKYLNDVRKYFPEAVVARREKITLYE